MEHYILPSSSVNIRDEYLQEQKIPFQNLKNLNLNLKLKWYREMRDLVQDKNAD